MKKILLFIVIISFCFGLNINVQAEEQKRYLSEMNGDECLKFLTNHGIEIPLHIQSDGKAGDFVKEIIIAAEKNPNIEFLYNYTVTLDFVNKIKNVVNKYYDVPNPTLFQYSSFVQPRAVSLQYSTMLEQWNETFQNYNCYLYAINKITTGSSVNPGYFSNINIGEGDDSNFSTVTLSRLAAITTYDLQTLGYTEITYGFACPSYNPNYRVIALKKDNKDYHFMHMYSNGVWRHKPGPSSVPLKYNYSLVASGLWTNEGHGRYGTYTYNHIYEGDIIYIRYKL